MEPQKSQGEIAFGRLMQAIEDGHYQPGDRLRETEIAERLSLSRTPIREALRRLESERIVEHRPRVGSVVRRLDHTEVVELYDMRRVLEGTAARMAAQHATHAEIATLAALNAEIDEASASPSEAAALNQKFHRVIYLAARNRYLQEAARAMTNALLLLGPTTLADPARIRTVVAQHEDILGAIDARAPEAAAQAAEAHLETSLRYRLRVLQG